MCLDLDSSSIQRIRVDFVYPSPQNKLEAVFLEFETIHKRPLTIGEAVAAIRGTGNNYAVEQSLQKARELGF